LSCEAVQNRQSRLAVCTTAVCVERLGARRVIRWRISARSSSNGLQRKKKKKRAPVDCAVTPLREFVTSDIFVVLTSHAFVWPGIALQ